MADNNLSYNERRLLLALDACGGSATPAQMIGSGRFALEVEIMGAASWLASKGLAKVDEESEEFYVLARDEGKLPERRAAEIIDAAGGTMEMSRLAEEMPGEDGIAVGWLRRKGLADIRAEDGSKSLVLTQKGREFLASRGEDEALLSRLADGPVPKSQVDAKLAKDLNIQSGKWRDAEFRRYDVQTFAPATYPAKKHPLSRLAADVRRLFTDMGFTEFDGEYVQPAFWNLDVLFIPQDHPARELQDTFYLEDPASIHVDDEALVGQVRSIHETGGDTGSTGWGGTWSREMAEQALLRTHTTVNSIRYIAEHPDAPQKMFSLSRIFRKESIDATHLPEFTQIEGIIIDEDGDFDMLVSLIREFYAKMGFDQIRIRPAYFPYTEPSLELEVFFNGKWMELGGAGIFRPEVVAPFGVKHPVLAWGFGFERLAMLKWGITDIRDLYISDIDDLKQNQVL